MLTTVLRKLNQLILAARVEETLIENLGNQLESTLIKQSKDWIVSTDIKGLKIKIVNKGGEIKTTYKISLINNKFITAIEIPVREVLDEFKSNDKDIFNSIVDSLNIKQDFYSKNPQQFRKYNQRDPYPMHRDYNTGAVAKKQTSTTGEQTSIDRSHKVTAINRRRFFVKKVLNFLSQDFTKGYTREQVAKYLDADMEKVNHALILLTEGGIIKNRDGLFGV